MKFLKILKKKKDLPAIGVSASSLGDSEAHYVGEPLQIFPSASFLGLLLLLPYKHSTIQLTCTLLYLYGYVDTCMHIYRWIYIYIYTISVSRSLSMLFIATRLYFLLHCPCPVSKIQLKRHLLETAFPHPSTFTSQKPGSTF